MTNNDTLRSAVELAEKTFRAYGDLHAAKPDPVKAERNYALADQMRAALASPATPALGWPEYGVDIAIAADGYSRERSSEGGAFGLTERMPATFRWHELWDRIGEAIASRPTDAQVYEWALLNGWHIMPRGQIWFALNPQTGVAVSAPTAIEALRNAMEGAGQ